MAMKKNTKIKKNSNQYFLIDLLMLFLIELNFQASLAQAGREKLDVGHLMKSP